jgi:hypothetical protein
LTALAEGKGLRSAKFRTLLDLAETSLASACVSFVVHPKVVLWETTRSVAVKEGAITTIEDVHVRIAEMGIIGSIYGTILFANIRGPEIEVSKC